MICEHCNGEIPVRAKGRGRRRTKWCNDDCKKARKAEALKVGRQALRKTGARKARRPRIDYLRRIERETFGFCAF